MKNFAVGFVGFFALLGGGCTTVSEAGYYWGKYSYTYLETIREPSMESNEKHIESLREILAKSDERSLKPPPGVSAELGFWLLKIDPTSSEATSLFEREIAEYPEAEVFIKRLLQL